MTNDEISAKLNTVPWYHRFEILPGVFIPNFSCLKGWMQAAGLSLVSQKFHDVADSPYPLQRVAGVARKVAGLRIEHGTV